MLVKVVELGIVHSFFWMVVGGKRLTTKDCTRQLKTYTVLHVTHFSTSLVKSKFYASICEFWLTHGAHYSLDNMHQTNLSRCNFRGRRKKKKDPRVEMRRNIDDQILTRTHVQLPFQKATPSSVTWKTYEEICYRYNKTINAVAVQYLLQFQDNSVTAFFSKPRGDLAYVLRSLALVSVSTFVRSESGRNVYSVAFTRST